MQIQPTQVRVTSEDARIHASRTKDTADLEPEPSIPAPTYHEDLTCSFGV